MPQAPKENLLHDANRGLDPTESKILPMRVASLYISWINCVSRNERGILKSQPGIETMTASTDQLLRA